MKAPDVGAFGVAALVAVLLIDVSALLVSIEYGRATVALVVAFATGRLAVTWACTPAALRRDPMGSAPSSPARRRPVPRPCSRFSSAPGPPAEALGATGLRVPCGAVAAVVVPLAVAHVLRDHCIRRFGGITGDVLGALVEVTTLTSLVVMAVGAG